MADPTLEPGVSSPMLQEDAIRAVADAMHEGTAGCTGGCRNRCVVDERDAATLAQTFLAAQDWGVLVETVRKAAGDAAYVGADAETQAHAVVAALLGRAGAGDAR